MNSAKSKRQLTLLTLVVALGVAVYLNWEYAKNDNGFAVTDTAPVDASVVETVTDGTAGGVTEALPDKNYGDAQLVSANAAGGSKFFEQARLTRTKSRDEALDKLQKSLKAANLTEEEKTKLTDHLTAVIAGITAESDIENMIKAKGFVDCVAFVDGEKINISVQTGSEGLDAAAVAQIRDVVLSKMETSAKNITIVEVK